MTEIRRLDPAKAIIMTVDWESFSDKTIEVAEVRLLGMVDLPSALALQKLTVHEVRLQSRLSAAILICEHPPAVSRGRQATILELPVDQRELEARLLTVHHVARDGGTILHVPGQLAIYVIVSLNECGYHQNEFCWRLQEAVLRSCREAQVAAFRKPDDPTGVWGRCGRLAEIAVGVDRGVTSFGIVLNVSCSLTEFSEIGRGLIGDRISSLNTERVRPTLMPQIRASLIDQITTQIGYPDYHIHTGHPFLKRTRQQVPLANDDAD
ncbi:MAG: hypothetical protein R3C49_03325 [Planctomycetaceae bacterium]